MAPLDAKRWAEVERLFTLAMDLPPGERLSWLEHKCPDEDLRREVSSLLEHAGFGLTSLDAAIAAASSAVQQEADPDLRWVGQRFGAYKMESIIGHGGMGTVYRACRADAEFQQQVAIKLLRAAAHSASTLQRFKRERQILADLQHRNIARLLDGGSTPDGVPYLVMEFIEGETITDWCERHALKTVEKLRLFLQVCDAVEFAHTHLVVHRDLKPGNIMVTADGTVKLLDFGIAKMLAPDARDATATTLGMRVMTPEYAAPEQVLGEPVSRAVDVYALGLVLYELLTGQKAQTIPDSSPGTVARVVCQTEPVSPAALQPALAGDLDNIIRVAIRKEPQRRYASTADLARDIRLYLESRPITARPDTLAYRAAKFLQRNRAAVAGALVSAIVFVGLALAYWLAAPGRAPRVLRVTQMTSSGHVDKEGGLAADSSHVYYVERAPGRWRLVRVPVGGGSPEPVPGSPLYPEILDISSDRTELLVNAGIGDDLPLWAMPTDGSAPRRIGDTSGHTAAWSPNGMRIVFGRQSSLYMVNSDGSGIHKLLDTPGKPGAVRWAPTNASTVLRFDASAPSGGVSLWDVRSDGTHPHLLLPNWDSAVTQIGDGNWIAGGRYYLFRSVSEVTHGLWAMKEGRRLLGLLDPHPVLIHSSPSGFWGAAPSPDGRRVYYISGQGRNQFVRYDAGRKEFVPFLPGKGGRWINFSKDGRWVAYTGGDHDTLWRSRPDGSEAIPLTPPSMYAYEPKWSPDGAWVLFYAAEAGKRSLCYVVPSTGGSPLRLTSLPPDAGFPAWSPDGSSVLFFLPKTTAAAGRGLYVMDWKTRTVSFLAASDTLSRSAWSPDGRHIAASDGKQLQVFDLQTRKWITMVRGEGTGIPFWSKNGRYVYYQNHIEAEQPIFRVPLDGGKIERRMSSRQIPQSDLTGYMLVSLAPDDAPIAAAGRSNTDIYALDLELP